MANTAKKNDDTSKQGFLQGISSFFSGLFSKKGEKKERQTPVPSSFTGNTVGGSSSQNSSVSVDGKHYYMRAILLGSAKCETCKKPAEGEFSYTGTGKHHCCGKAKCMEKACRAALAEYNHVPA